MKSLLKLVCTLALATIPVVTVVACGSENNQMTPRDILNSAASSFITDSNLQVKADLNLSDNIDIKAMEGKTFSELNSSSELNKNVQTAISKFFANKLKESTNEHPTNWYHPDAHVKIMDYVPKKDNDDNKKNKAKFVLPTGSELVNGHLWVKAEISYLNLPSVTKDIKITINNDTSNSSDQKKADAIKEFIRKLIKGEINNNILNVNVENLPISGKIVSDNNEKNDEKAAFARNQLSYIKQNLNVAIKDKVQYSGLNLSFAFSGDFSNDKKSTLFEMKGAKINNDDKSIIFNGDVNNITIDFLVGNNGISSALNTADIGSVKINQTFVDATTQISKMFSEWTVKSVQNLPNASEIFSSYSQANQIKTEVIANGYFANINKIYDFPDHKWTYSIITITNPESEFNLNPNEKNGYFNLNFKLEYDLSNSFPDIGTTSKFNINVENIHIKLREI